MKKILLGVLILAAFLSAELAQKVYPTEIKWDKASFTVQTPLDWKYDTKDAKQEYLKFAVFPKEYAYMTTPVFFFADGEHKYIAGKETLKAYLEKDRRTILGSQRDAKVKKIKNSPSLKIVKQKLAKTYQVKNIQEVEAVLPSYKYSYVRYVYFENPDSFHTIGCFAKDRSVFDENEKLFYEFVGGFDYLKK